MNRPVALVCYICGREFGTKSLAIHIKSCQKKWENEQNLKPPRERRPCPQPPKGLDELLSKDSITKNDIQKMNNGAFDTYMEQALIQCEYCGRRFNPTSLKPHQKACKINPMIKKPSKVTQAKNEESQEPDIPIPKKGYNLDSMPQGNVNQVLEECYKCGRKFASDRLQKHEKVCKGQGIKVEKEPPKPAPIKQTTTKPQKDPKWKVQHEQFQNALKYMRQMKKHQENGGKISDLPPPPKGNYDHYIECQYCGRKYAPDVAQRHIPKCKDIINKPGGIKPSTIQQKYIGNSGAQGAGQRYSSNTKPTSNIAPTMSTMKQAPSPVMTSTKQGPTISTVKQSAVPVRGNSLGQTKTSNIEQFKHSMPQPKMPTNSLGVHAPNSNYGRMFKK